MKHIPLSREEANKIAMSLVEAGYTEHTKKMYVRYSKEYGNSVFIHHSLQIIRCTGNTEAVLIIQKNLGPPNGIASESQDERFCSWFLNGYEGKAGTTLN